LCGIADDEFYQNILGNYWSPERRHVENNYAELFFPFEKLPSLTLEITTKWHLQGVLNDINTWSAIALQNNIWAIYPLKHLKTN